jgi:hypothetical protein
MESGRAPKVDGSVSPYMELPPLIPATAFSLFMAAQELRRSQLESVGDPVQPGGVLSKEVKRLLI